MEAVDRDVSVVVSYGLCLLAALTGLVFAVRLYEPFIAAKEVLVQAGTATIAICWLWSGGAKKLVLTPTWIPIASFLGIGTASLMWSSNVSVTFQTVQYFSIYVLLFAVASSAFRSTESRTALAVTMFFVGSIEAAYVLLQCAVGDPFFAVGQLSGKWAAFGTLGNPNWTGEFLAVAALVTLGRLIDLRRSEKTGYFAGLSAFQGTFAGFTLMTLALAATLARGAAFAFIVGAAAFFIVGRNENGLRIRSIVSPAAAIVAGVVFVLLAVLSNQAAIDNLLNVKSFRGRILIWEATVMMIRDAPIFGHGAGTFGLNFPVFQADILSSPTAASFIPNASFTTFAHNDYLQIWAEFGVAGIIAVLVLVWMLLKRGRTLASDPLTLGLWAAMISILVNAAVAFPFHLPTTLMLFVILVAAIEAAVVRKTSDLTKHTLHRSMAFALPVLMICFSAYWSGYDRIIADAALWRADAALESRQFDKAEPDIRTALEHAPQRLDGHLFMGRLMVARRKYEQALVSLETAKKLGADADVFDLQATALKALGRKSEAILALNELARLRPDLKWAAERVSSINVVTVSNEEDIR